ncbi:MAG: family 20 glycosylhydrolase, partial [Bacteroidota bacterium]
WELIENDTIEDIGSTCAFTFTNEGSTPMPATGWALYFNQLPRVFDNNTSTGNVHIETINGGFFKLSPTEAFSPIAPGAQHRMTFETTMWVIKKAGTPEGLYFVVGGQEPVAVSNYQRKPFTEAQLKRNKDDNFPVPSPAFRFAQNAKLNTTNTATGKIIPTPVSLNSREKKCFIGKDWTIQYEGGLSNEAAYLAKALEPLLRNRLKTQQRNSPTTKSIQLSIDPTPIDGQSKEAYRLTIDENIRITGTDAAGVFYGIQSLRALLPVSYLAKAEANLALPYTTMTDYPRFAYRGMHFDVSRNFTKKEYVIKLLEAMSFYKLNKFHFHLTDDEGWRLEIPGLPELTSVGAQRGHTTDESDRLFPAYGSGPFKDFPGSGFYSKADFIDILKYATERHIEVIPEIDMPGHARAAIKAMDARYSRLKATGDEAAAKEYLLRDLQDASVYKSVQDYPDNVVCVCEESTYQFLEKVTDEILAMYEAANAPLTTVHIGGDEVPAGVWKESPACQQLIAEDDALQSTQDLWPYFVRRFDDILSERQLTTGGWEEIAMITVEENGKKIHKPNPAFAKRQLLPYFWNSIFGWGNEDVGYQLANAGYDVVMCSASNLYFDLSYDKDPDESGLYWAGFVNTRSAFEYIPMDLFKSADMGRFGQLLDPDKEKEGKVQLTAEGRKHIVGIQGQLWSETIRNGEMTEHFIFPKLLGLAERAWAQSRPWESLEDTDQRRAALDRDWNLFANTIGQREMPRLDFLAGGLKYRIPPAGAKIENGKVLANTAFPGLLIRYTTDGSEPTKESSLYEGPIDAGQQIKLKVFSPNGHSSRSTTIGNDQTIQ